MITFGLTGGIACGKSSVANTFEYHNIPMVDADMVARKVVEVGTVGWQQILDTFGSQYLLEDKSLNRSKLASLVFSNKLALDKLNAIMGPLIIEESTRRLSRLHQDGYEIIGYNAALICEMGNADKYRPLVVVACTPEIQLARLMKRNNLKEAEAWARINAQMPSDARCDLADFIIETSGSIELSIQQTEVVIYELQKMNK